jgi:LysM repeat protein
MHKRIQSPISFAVAFFFLLVATFACTSKSEPAQATNLAVVNTPTGSITGAPTATNTNHRIVDSSDSQIDTPSATTEYIVQAGDTCRKIAFEHNISVESLIEINKLAPDCSNLTIDQKLIVPAIGNDFLVSDTPMPEVTWPVYMLATKLPDSPTQLHLYKQTVPGGLPNEESLAALMAQLKITGTVSTRPNEAGDITMDITGDQGHAMLVSVDPLIMVLENGLQTPQNSTSARITPPEIRAKAAEAFLDARGLLDFPYIMEPPQLSRDRDRAIRITPLIDGYPLYDYDPLNGRLLVKFNPAGEVSVVYWKPLKIFAGDLVNIQPASVAWEQLVSGDTPKKNGMGQCWQAMLFDPNEPNARAVADPPSCVNWGGKANRSYDAATISDVKLVYFANDLSLGMSPFAFPADSPVRDVFPMWQFSGVTSDGRDLVILWPACLEP